ncbi:MAG: hypothetical protein ACKOYM_07170 [Actinomycetes bacterium]
MTNVVRTRMLLAVAVGVAGAGVVGQRNAIAQTPSPPPRKVVVVGDSIILGAQQPMTRALAGIGRTVVFDAAVSRSTSAGAEAVAGHRSDLTDSLVVNLGANDAGSTALFARRVEKVLAAAGSVPRIYWLTIREVRPYYPAANQVLRDAARRYPNLHVVDWNAVAAAPGLTSGDGLHLTSRGALTMTDTLLRAIAAVEASGASKRTTTTARRPRPLFSPVRCRPRSAPRHRVRCPLLRIPVHRRALRSRRMAVVWGAPSLCCSVRWSWRWCSSCSEFDLGAPLEPEPTTQSRVRRSGLDELPRPGRNTDSAQRKLTATE